MEFKVFEIYTAILRQKSVSHIVWFLHAENTSEEVKKKSKQQQGNSIFRRNDFDEVMKFCLTSDGGVPVIKLRSHWSRGIVLLNSTNYFCDGGVVGRYLYHLAMSTAVISLSKKFTLICLWCGIRVHVDFPLQCCSLTTHTHLYVKCYMFVCDVPLPQPRVEMENPLRIKRIKE